MPVSFRASEQIKGGLISDVDGTLTRIRMESDIYENGTPSIGGVGIITLEDGSTERVIWSLGRPEEWEILDAETVTEGGREFQRGTQVDSVKGHTGTVDSSNLSMMMREMENAGFPANKKTDYVTCVEGVKAHWIRKPQQKRAGLEQQAQPEGRERTVLVPEKVLLMPGEKGKGTQAKSTGAGTKATPAATASNALENEAAVAIAESAAGVMKATKAGTVLKGKWVTTKLGVFSKADGYTEADKTVKDAVAEIFKNAEWLAEHGITTLDSGDMQIEA